MALKDPIKIEKWRKWGEEYRKRPEIKERIRKYGAEYSRRPDVKAKRNEIRRKGHRIEYITNYRRKWQKDFPEKVRQYAHDFKVKRRNELLDFLGDKCGKCGFVDRRAFQIDHKNGGGSKERKLVRAGLLGVMYKMMKNGPVGFRQKYQLLCANCNWIKRLENNEIKRPSLEYNVHEIAEKTSRGDSQRR
jgi:hypothetical protein